MISCTVPRVLLAGTNSGCGKTTLTCAILQALVDRGLAVSSCKCGPDYIDPMFHSGSSAPKHQSRPLLLFPGHPLLPAGKKRRGRRLSVIEGVMGYYDGIGITIPGPAPMRWPRPRTAPRCW